MSLRIFITAVALFSASLSQKLHSQNGDLTRTHDLRFRWNMGQFANIGRYAFQFGIEKDIADNKTLGGELGLSYYRGGNNLLYTRYNYQGIQGFIEYRNYFKSFHATKAKPYVGLGLFGRQLGFDADVALGYNIKSTRDWNNATHYENTTARYSTFTARLHAIFGYRLPISSQMYFEMSGGPAFGFYSIDHDIDRSVPFVIDNFTNPFFMSSQKGTYFSPALYGQLAFGFVLARQGGHSGTKP